jgi:hypothetical protein
MYWKILVELPISDFIITCLAVFAFLNVDRFSEDNRANFEILGMSQNIQHYNF